MEETNLNEEMPVAYVMDAYGTITDEFHEGDSYTKHTKEAKEKKAAFLQEASKSLAWLRFTQERVVLLKGGGVFANSKRKFKNSI